MARGRLGIFIAAAVWILGTGAIGAVQAAEEVHVGVLAPLSGPAASYGGFQRGLVPL